MRKAAALAALAVFVVLSLSLVSAPWDRERSPEGFSFGGRKVLEVPFVWQKPWYCSEASASMVLQYYGFNLTQDEINAMGFDRFEVLEPLVERYVYCEYRSLTLVELKREIDEGDPVMIRILPGLYLHTVVIVGYDGEYLIVHDPARGPYIHMRVSELVREWSATGFAALVFERKAA